MSIYIVRFVSRDHLIICRLPVVDISVPTYELPLPEGVGEEKLQQENLSVREIEESWKEKLHESTASHIRPSTQ